MKLTVAKHKSRNIFIWVTILIQVLSTVLFVGDFLLENYIPTSIHVSWRAHEIIEIMTVIGLTLGTILGFMLGKQLIGRNMRVEAQLRVVSGEFQRLLDENFAQWGLSPSERDVAYFAIKGMSNQEISALRGTSEGTIKAQMNAVYKKAAVESRTQLLGYFIEELLATDADLNAA